MTQRGLYHIADEPTPGALSRFVVDPFWPVMACMMVGGIPGLAWLIFNGVALGSPTRGREALICVAGMVGALLVLGLVMLGQDAGLISERAARYIALLAIFCKLGAGCMAAFFQQSALELHEYFGGQKANGWVVLLVAAVVLRPVMQKGVGHAPFAWVLFS